MIRINNEILNKSLKSLMIMQVHDELVFECPDNEIDQILTIVKEGMSKVIKMRVPLKIDIETGECWC